MAPTATDPVLKRAYVTPTGKSVIIFEGYETLRSSRVYPFLVVTLCANVTQKWSTAKQDYVACQPQIIIQKGTGDGLVARKRAARLNEVNRGDSRRTLVLRLNSKTGEYVVWS